MATVPAFEAKTRFGKLVDRVIGGEEITITRHGKPVARLIPEGARNPDAMKRNRTAKADDGLTCTVCGNKDRFVEFMDVEIHLVNGHKDYIRLLDGIPDHYLCDSCGARIEEPTATKK
ncbi:MAG: type II toxin-antitoxin system prevent-host-death family antitoxin [Verrucomicrobiota bacterium]|jgi:prevent-host-death family protein